MEDPWINKPPSYKDNERLYTALKEKNINVIYFVGNFAFDRNDNYTYYLTTEMKLMRVKTTSEPFFQNNFMKLQKMHWNAAGEF